jgi:hypothetical protein
MAHDGTDLRYVNKNQLEGHLEHIGELFNTGEALIKTLTKENEHVEAELKKNREENRQMRWKICSHERTRLDELWMRTSLQEDNQFLREQNSELRKKLGMQPKKMDAGCGHTETAVELRDTKITLHCVKNNEKELVTDHVKILELLQNACWT